MIDLSMTGIQIRISDRTAARLDRARHHLDGCSLSADYSEVIVASLDAADVELDMTETSGRVRENVDGIRD